MQNKLELDKNSEERVIKEIKKFFENERAEEIGDLQAKILLQFIIKNIASEFYNKGIKDCIANMHEKVEDLYGLEI